jgi:enoyl-CoA hydratase
MHRTSSVVQSSFAPRENRRSARATARWPRWTREGRAVETGFETIHVARRERVLTLTLNRPDQMNAVNTRMHQELAEVFRFAQRDPDSDVVVLTGAGRAFSAGGDIPWMQEAIDRPALFETIVAEAKEIVFSLLDLEKPIIAKVNGAAAGLGATMALFCDAVFMAETAVLVDPHIKVGLVAGDGGAVIWPQLIGYVRAKHYLMTGAPVTAPDALAMGLVTAVHPKDALDAAVDAYADGLMRGATMAIRWTKVAVNIGLKQLAHAIMDTSLAYEALTNATPDHQEAVHAFVERRPPVFARGGGQGAWS